MATQYLLVRHDVDEADGSVIYTPLGAYDSSQDAVRALKDLGAAADLSTDVFSVFRRVYSDLKATAKPKMTVSISGLQPTRKRKPKAQAPIEEPHDA